MFSLWIKPTDALNSNFIGITTLHVSGSLSANHQEFLAIHRLSVGFIQKESVTMHGHTIVKSLVLHFWYQRNYKFYGNRNSKYGSGLCTLYFSNQVLKYATYFSRTFIKYSEYSNTFWHFFWKTCFLQAFEEDKSSGENTEKIIIWKKWQLYFLSLKKLIEVKQKNQKWNKSRRAANSKV